MNTIDLRAEAKEIVAKLQEGGTNLANVKQVTIKVELVDGTTIEKVIQGD